MFSYYLNQFELCFYTCNRNANQYILLFIHFVHITLFFWSLGAGQSPSLHTLISCLPFSVAWKLTTLGWLPGFWCSGFQLGSVSRRRQQDMRWQKKILGCNFNIPTSLKAAFLLSAVPSKTVAPSGGPSSLAPFLPCFFSPGGKVSLCCLPLAAAASLAPSFQFVHCPTSDLSWSFSIWTVCGNSAFF